MNIKVKTALIIIFTMVIGIVIGALLNRALLQHRIRRVFSMQKPRVMATVMRDIIRPDSDQAKLIREILDKHVERMSDLREKNRREMESAMKELWKEMDSILTPEQKKRLERNLPPPFRMMRFPERRRPFRDQPRRIPPPEDDRE